MAETMNMPPEIELTPANFVTHNEFNRHAESTAATLEIMGKTLSGIRRDISSIVSDLATTQAKTGSISMRDLGIIMAIMLSAIGVSVTVLTMVGRMKIAPIEESIVYQRAQMDLDNIRERNDAAVGAAESSRTQTTFVEVRAEITALRIETDLKISNSYLRAQVARLQWHYHGHEGIDDITVADE